MTEEVGRQLSLDRPAIYQIRVRGYLDESWSDWVGAMTIAVEGEGKDRPITTLTGPLDQAALLGLLRRLYSLGLPLVSVICRERDLENERRSCRREKSEGRGRT